MADALVVSRAHPPGERSAGDLEAVPDQLTVDSFAGKISVQWAPQEAVTPLGQLPFFIDFLKQSGLFEQLVREAPLSYTSPNAPRPRDVLGTLTSQLPVDSWHGPVGDPTVADSILDRMVHHAHRFELRGESLRKVQGRAEIEASQEQPA